jgi:hypothetical protein
MLFDLVHISKQPSGYRAVTAPAPAETTLDPRLANTGPALPSAELVDQILADHGPNRPGGPVCKGCGSRYRSGAADCPSVLYALSSCRGQASGRERGSR